MIDKSEDQLKSVKSTVETELKSYYSVVSKTCAAALAPKKIHAAVKKVATQKERCRNVVIYGLPETQSEQLQNKVDTVLIEIGEKPSIRVCCRVGAQKENAVRPVKFTVNSSDHAAQLIRNAKKLRTKEGYRSVYICPDRTVAERKAYKKLVEELKVKRTAEPEKFHCIRNNKIVSSVKSSESVLPGQT